MATARKLYASLMFFCLFFFNSSAIQRDPFKPIETNQRITLEAIMILPDAKLASISYRNKNYSVAPDEFINNIFKVIDILESSVKLLNLRTNKEEYIHLHT